MMAAGPQMRASDDDRDRVASVLREHYAQGRLTVEEFDERLEQLYASRTYGELATLTSDLPDVDLRAMREVAPCPPAKEETVKGRLLAMWGPWAFAVSVNWGIWFAIGMGDDFDFPYPWPLWVMGPWGAILLVATVLMKFGDGRKP
ncbi:DUF1707 SHOCT-like domain-containing protein [Planomonospora parontospora]|uniref:DUF1707 SHOCT-like domain-containing protein n=1 Tax=Planomonospora parontospora TaxID=58119 RepID=UPI00194431E3|nr:DUF1707 domain-containing protein [Planomonospora parontospora]GGL06336.1 hypothetical protein GCM10014719_05730 [Planomonospora parontospora subsp. antibiotica]GII14211.1 hypothetical protein Ppa05_09370 [Planomonospora parontospora subsp. antibiotica]